MDCVSVADCVCETVNVALAVREEVTDGDWVPDDVTDTVRDGVGVNVSEAVPLRVVDCEAECEGYCELDPDCVAEEDVDRVWEPVDVDEPD